MDDIFELRILQIRDAEQNDHFPNLEHNHSHESLNSSKSLIENTFDEKLSPIVSEAGITDFINKTHLPGDSCS